ncbi:acetyl-CoA synthetase-like protein [Hortaea werneckii]|nr:acetyl-CoA synthetase-like protein [Hortaea werneckii]KAI7217285.1 acetyl-CoA synthetase-like protein [Hortaea werneckii]KAI7297244.1 acetyl-CoA synthetase-like protein [Hortaea werneckii]KAI7383827.1 acetyl-CoA synthetase-like protein [Hortaea werneckii]
MSCGERTILATIGDIAKTTPDREWTTYAQSRECFERGQLRTVTFAELANAIDRLAWHLDEALSSRRDKETVGYIGPNDVSERQADPTLSKLVDEGTVQVIDIPAIETLLSSHPVQTFPYEADFRTCLNDAFIILHTSGSTGLPKPVEITHGLIATIDAQQLLPDVDGRHTAAREWAHRSVYTALPPFHSAGFNFFSFSVFQSTHLVMGPADQPPSLDTVEQILNIGCASAAVIPPSLLAEVAADEKLLPRLSEWSSVAFGGGPLPRDAGDAIWKHTKILQCLGSTETFNVPELVPRSIDEWPYHDFHPDLCISFMERQQGLHELVFIRNESSLKHQGAFWTFPELNEYPMKDLYEQHPSKPSMWAYRGRVDDVVVLSNGEKIMPKDAENAIASDENVRAALIVGNGQAQPGLLVEPKDELSGEQVEQVQASLSATVNKANRVLPGHGQIHASHVRLLSRPDSFLRSAKGEIQRAPTTEALSETIQSLFSSAGMMTNEEKSFDFTNEHTLVSSLSDTISAEFLEGRRPKPDDNLFDCGFDSLKVLKMVKYIKSAYKRHDAVPGNDLSITSRLIYQHPTLRSLSRAVLLAAGGQNDGEGGGQEDIHAHMNFLLQTYSSRLNGIGTDRPTAVVLTGSTGSLGSYILDNLLRNPKVDKVFCLNRSSNAMEKQRQNNESRGLTQDFSKADFLQVNLAQFELNLDKQKYTMLRTQATHIIHNAWPVDFNMSLSTFEPQLEGCLRLIELACTAPVKPEMMFLSSVGAANNWCSISSTPVPEESLQDFNAAESMGYAQSKLLAEQIFDRASAKHDVPVKTCRVGQITGPVNSEKGMWSTNEWLPSMLLSCKALRAIPESLGSMDAMAWIPCDLLSTMLVDTILVGPSKWTSNEPASGSWPDIPIDEPESDSSVGSRSPSECLSSSKDTASSHEKADVVSLPQWVDALARVADSEDNISQIPAVRLLEFFRGIASEEAQKPVFSTSRSTAHCKMLRDLPPVSVPWFKQWLKQWEKGGALT